MEDGAATLQSKTDLFYSIHRDSRLTNLLWLWLEITSLEGGETI